MALFAEVESTLAAFAHVPPALLAERALLCRIDQKYVLDPSALRAVLSTLQRDYAVLPVGAGGVATYQNVYFDTPELTCFHDHRRGRRIRRKVRIRHYLDRALSFLEVKTKRSERVTSKQRRAIEFSRPALAAQDQAFLREHAGELADALVPTLRIDYRRATLVNLRHEERVTIDFDLTAARDADQIGFGGLVIVEIKRVPSTQPRTAAMQAFSALGLRERAFSKYCASTSLIRSDVRHNRLRPDLRAVARPRAILRR